MRLVAGVESGAYLTYVSISTTSQTPQIALFTPLIRNPNFRQKGLDATLGKIDGDGLYIGVLPIDGTFC